MRAGIAVVGLAGCNAILGLEPTRPSDGPCAHGTAVIASQPVALDGTHSVEAARFARNQQVAYLSLCPTAGTPQQIKAGCDLFTSVFSPEAQAFGGFSVMNGISSTVYDAYPTITPDLQHLIFGSERAMNGTVSVWVAAATNGSFDAATITQPPFALAVAGSNEPYLVGEQGATLYYSATVDGSDWDIYRTEGAPPGFGAGLPVAGVNGATGEFAPVVSDDDLEIFFASDRLDPSGNFDLDIFAATRASASVPFGAPSRVDAVSTNRTTDWPVWLSSDGCELYYIHKEIATGIATLAVASR